MEQPEGTPLNKWQAQNFRLLLRTWIMVLVMILLTLGMRQFGWFEPLELYAYDWRMRLRPNMGPDPRLLIVAVTEKDIQQYKQFPLPDSAYADVLKQILIHQPTAIGLDIYRDFPQPKTTAPDIYQDSPQDKGTGEFLEILREHSNIVVIQRLSENLSQASVPPPPGVPETRVGFNDLVVDVDGVIRRNLIFAGHHQRTYSSFSWKVALKYLREKGIYPSAEGNNPLHIRLGEAVLKPLKEDSGNYQDIDSEGYQILLNYRPTLHIAERLSLSEVVAGALTAEQVRNKIVLIGTVAESARDIFVTPYSRERALGFYMPGVEIHAAKISELISVATGDFGIATPAKPGLFRFWGEAWEIVWILAWSLLGGLLAWWLRHPLKLPLAIVVSFGLLFFLHWHLFQSMLWVPLAAPLLGLLLVSSSVLMARYLYYAFYDELTGLPNRTLFMQKLRTLRRKHWHLSAKTPQTQGAIALVLLDLDRFKIINAVLGHDAGDALIVAFTQRVQLELEATHHAHSHHPAFLARVGGTEFSFILNCAADDAQTPTELANNIRMRMHHPFNLRHEEVFTHANIGIAMGYVDDARDLLRDARAAMNRAKLLEKDAPEMFAIDMEEKAIEHFKLERDLRRATHYYRPEMRPLDEEWSLPAMPEFVLYYQPVIDLNTGRISGFEALVRWLHPQRGLVSPGEFIPVAEETGLIVPIGEWILYQACLQMRQWQEQFPEYPNLVISVNLSGRQFSQPFLAETIQKISQKTDLVTQNLKLEITESAVMDDIKTTLSILHQLKSIDLQLSIDDFGTGYSSMEYLTQFPTDTLKVDQSFVRQMHETPKNKVVVETIVELAHRLGMNIICEGIEEEEQLKQLRALGCEFGQGYLFSRPVPGEEAEALLKSNPQW